MTNLLINEWLEDFINEFFKSKNELLYTDFVLQKDKYSFYIKFVDKLRPNVYIINNSYYFNTFIILKDTVNNIYTKQTKHELFKYLINYLDNSTEYLNYLNRLNHVVIPTN